MPAKVYSPFRLRKHKGKAIKQPWHFVKVAKNGQVKMTSENYSRRYGAVKAILSEAIDLKQYPNPLYIDETI